jgi:hypothetical protein
MLWSVAGARSWTRARNWSPARRTADRSAAPTPSPGASFDLLSIEDRPCLLRVLDAGSDLIMPVTATPTTGSLVPTDNQVVDDEARDRFACHMA